jgi:hypothetical protein
MNIDKVMKIGKFPNKYLCSSEFICVLNFSPAGRTARRSSAPIQHPRPIRFLHSAETATNFSQNEISWQRRAVGFSSQGSQHNFSLLEKN